MGWALCLEPRYFDTVAILVTGNYAQNNATIIHVSGFCAYFLLPSFVKFKAKPKGCNYGNSEFADRLTIKIKFGQRVEAFFESLAPFS